MTIQMLRSWNGLEDGEVYTLSTAEETRLIGLGLARDYSPGIDGLSTSMLSLATAAVVEASTSSQRKLVALVGSSLTDVGIASNTLYGTRRRLNRSWFDWMNYALRERAMEFPISYAVGGSPISTVLTQIQTAGRQSVDWIIGDLGVINSVANGDSVAAMIAGVTRCIDAIQQSGKRGLLINATPVAAGQANASLSNMRKLAAVNQHMAKYGRAKGVLIYDASAAIVLGSDANGYAQSALMQADLIHYAHTGARVMGAALATLMSPELPIYPILPSSQADSYSATDNPNQLCTNPLMVGSTAVSGGTGLTGNMPTGRAVSAAGGTFTGTSAVAARSDGYGQDWTITVTAASAPDARMFLTLEPDMTASVTAGDILQAVAQVEITGATNLKGQLFRLQPSGAADYAGIHEITSEGSLIAEYSQADMTGGIFITPPLMLPAGSTNLRLFLELQWSSSTAAAVIKVSRVGVNRLVAT